MVIDPQSLSPGAMYHFMISVIVPRPIAFISTCDREGHLNLAPFSYFLPLTNAPPLLGVSLQSRDGRLKDTARNIEEVGELVVNIVSEPMTEDMVLTSGEWPPHVDEFALAHFTPVPSDLVRPPRVGESRVSFECRHHRTIEFGQARFVTAEILRVHVSDEVLDERGRVVVERLAPVGRLGGDGYAPLREVLHYARPVVDRGRGRS